MTTEVLYRSAPGLEIRSAANGGDGRTVEGLAVPYNVRQRIDDTLVEMFAPGAFRHQIETAHRAASPGGLPAYRVHFAAEHVKLGGRPIGRTIELREDAAGLYGAWRVAKTPAGDEALALIEEGVYSELSVGFRTKPGWSRRLDDGTVVRTRASLFEVAVVLQGAYGRGAVVTGVRSEGDDGDHPVRTRLSRARALAAGWPILGPVA